MHRPHGTLRYSNTPLLDVHSATIVYAPVWLAMELVCSSTIRTWSAAKFTASHWTCAGWPRSHSASLAGDVTANWDLDRSCVRNWNCGAMSTIGVGTWLKNVK
ncbi:hypothetical protein H257_06186 [Aphanomyces astaci]|uniref:Uncharacterized protein n=1 Tax=Aphanomyces astaci TaxID=112090 RepID=W4GMV1_APHAT|nr:hypothetical protein H257_06186 [Aphanomyces astaci]ETV80681.1 hypothetical protein H257_06186 [Aphanomyces astaci]|eukprot:XP_009829628.1 hypothetical protein H257_06186 [Aphanomyces astaci]